MAKKRLHLLPPGVLRFYKVERWLYLLASLLWLVPIWTNTYFLTPQGPSHVYNSQVLLGLLTGNSAYSEFFAINPQAVPSWFTTFSLAMLQLIFGPVTSEKIFVSCCLLAFMWYFRWLLGSIHKGERFLAWLAMPLAFHIVFAMGLYNFSWSLVLFLYILRYWYKYRRRFTGDRMFRLMLLLVLSYFMHPVGFVLTLVGLAVISVFSSFRYWPNTPRRNKLFFQDSAVKLVVLIVAALPALGLFIDFYVRFQKAQRFIPTPDPAIGTRVMDLLEISTIQIFDPGERIASIGLSILIILFALYAARYAVTHRRTLSHNMFLFAGIVAWVLYLFTSSGTGAGSLLIARLQLFPWIFLILWLAEERFPIPMKTAAVTAGLAISCYLVFLRLPYYRDASAMAAKYAEVWDRVPSESVIITRGYVQNNPLPGGMTIQGPFDLIPPALPARKKHAVILNNFDAARGYYPVLWRPERDPYRIPVGKQSEKPEIITGIDPVEFQRSTGRKVDFIIQNTAGQRPYTVKDHPGPKYTLRYATADSLLLLYGHK